MAHGRGGARRRRLNPASPTASSAAPGNLGTPSVFSEPGPEPSIASTAGAPLAAAPPAPAEDDSDNVDPIAEADVYMAYGRDAQAEEILKEALAKNPGRSALQLKLLEVYAARKDARSFEQLFMKLKDATGAQGPEWKKAMSLGRGLDPQNPAYGGGAAIAADDTQRMEAVVTPSVDFEIGGGAAEPAGTLDMALDSVSTVPGSPAASVDFDLGGGTLRRRRKSPNSARPEH